MSTISTPTVSRVAVRDDLVLGGAVVSVGLLAGFFYAYACSVMPGLRSADDRAFVEAMQNINVSTPNPVFLATFMGGPVLATCAYLRGRRGDPQVARWLLAGALLTGACILVTVAFNIPLNDELERAGNPATIADIAQVRDDFETPWTIWHVVRTVAVVGGFACLARAMQLRARQRT